MWYIRERIKTIKIGFLYKYIKDFIERFTLTLLFVFIVITNIIGFINLKVMSQLHILKDVSLFIGLSVLHFIIVSSRMVTWFKILRKETLSSAYPMISITFPVMLIISNKFFGETVTLLKVAGTILIILGILINRYNNG